MVRLNYLYILIVNQKSNRWKNNIERKNKFLALLKDAYYFGQDDKLIARLERY